MANRVKELKTRALEKSKIGNELKEQRRTNMRDLSINAELRGIRFEDESAASEVESVSNAVTGEQKLIRDKICKNEKEIDKVAGETDDYINSLKGNLRKMERMEKASDLAADVGGQKADTKGKIDELEDIKRMLGVEEPSPGRVKESFKRFGAGVGALITAAAGGVSVLRNPTEKYSVPEAVPAIYQRFERPQKENPPNVTQKVGEIGDAIINPLNELGDFLKKKDEMDEWANSTTKETRSSGSLD